MPLQPNITPQQALQDAKDNLRYNRVAIGASSFVVLGGVFYHFVEKLSWLDAFYFTTMTLATVGYGDIAPKTAVGKVFTMFYVLIGITIFVVLARIVLGRLVLRNSPGARAESDIYREARKR